MKINKLTVSLSDSASNKSKLSSSLLSKKRSPDPHRSAVAKKGQNRHDSDSDPSPPRKRPLKGNASDSDQSPPRRPSKTKRGSDSDQSPPRGQPPSGRDSDGDLRRHDSPDVSPPRRRHLSPPRQCSGKSEKMQSKDSASNKSKLSSSLLSKKRSPDPHRSAVAKKGQNRHDSDSDPSPPRKRPLKGNASDSDQSPPRRPSKTKRGSDSDQSPPRGQPPSGRDSDGDLSPPRRPGQSQGQRMLSGGKAGLVSVDILRKEQKENRHESRKAQTIFRDKSGKRRDLDSERNEQKKKAGEKAATDEKYAQWGKRLAQIQMHHQKLKEALREALKPLEDLDRMLREQEREGDPMAAMRRRKKDRGFSCQKDPA
uniref:BUD13 homolog n=1 Tax=Maylandia zebra TaxID=106582 RepID=A0A3P9CTQ4_9CICH